MNISDLSICLVTFRQRRELVKSLIETIRRYSPYEIDIILAVNGNINEQMSDDYRLEMLDLSKQYKNIYPIVCSDFMSLSKLWNTLIIFSKTEYNFVMTDDLYLNNPNIFNEVLNIINETGEGFFTINNGFSHFVTSKDFMNEIGYFDERLLAYGEEDGDLVHRYIKMYNKNVPNFLIRGLRNLAAYDLRMDNTEYHIDNKPTVNREISKLKYKDNPNGITGMNPTPISQTGLFEDYQQYPYESFVKKNKFNIKKFQKIIME
jgi:hypothetical protein